MLKQQTKLTTKTKLTYPKLRKQGIASKLCFQEIWVKTVTQKNIVQVSILYQRFSHIKCDMVSRFIGCFTLSSLSCFLNKPTSTIALLEWKLLYLGIWRTKE